jgi:hypothetical protein
MGNNAILQFPTTSDNPTKVDDGIVLRLGIATFHFLDM